MLCSRHFNKGKSLNEVRVTAPPGQNTVEQLLALQQAVSQVETLVQDGNIVLLKFRALLLAAFPQVLMLFFNFSHFVFSSWQIIISHLLTDPCSD